MSLLRLTRQLPSITRTTTSSTRSFTVAARRMAEGDAGATRSGGAAQGDAFTKREQASEDFSIRQREKEKLEALKRKVAEVERKEGYRHTKVNSGRDEGAPCTCLHTRGSRNEMVTVGERG
ncbi:ATPase inhibitor [Recurvomyces mirabilis]|uniref:ATPase inhibitor n=1 Tax=Recurvomyces mirabilis TaxID=574656 RepID=UPI002DE0208B|nr:ATPase inhibitor [Recurvomyces mirabilis]